MTQTSINGLLGRGSMFVFSRSQLNLLLGLESVARTSWKGEYLLDLGAGDGEVTQVMAERFEHTHVTEISTTMKWTLEKKGFSVFEVENWANTEYSYDLISCLNLLDRCDRPLTLLRQIKAKLRPGTGKLLLALVLPFKPYVEVGNADNQPSEKMKVEGSSFEDQVRSLVHNVFEPEGWRVDRWSRVPYLCEGDLHQSYYWLFDAIFVLAPVQNGVASNVSSVSSALAKDNDNVPRSEIVNKHETCAVNINSEVDILDTAMNQR